MWFYHVFQPTASVWNDIQYTVSHDMHLIQPRRPFEPQVDVNSIHFTWCHGGICSWWHTECHQGYHVIRRLPCTSLDLSAARQPICPPGKRDEACHLLACAQSEMTFERRAKWECSFHSSTAVRSHHCYFSCLSKEGVLMVCPLCCIKVPGMETQRLALLCKSG